MRVAPPPRRLPTCLGRARVRAATTRSSLARAHRAPDRAETTPSRLHVLVRPVDHVQALPRRQAPLALVQALQARVPVVLAAQAGPHRVALVRAASPRVQVALAEQAEPQAAVQPSAAPQAAARQHQAAVRPRVAADVVEAPLVPSAVRAQGRRADGSPSVPSGPSTSSSRRHPLAACRYLVATATRRCAFVAVRR